MIAIMGLSVVLYSRCFRLLLVGMPGMELHHGESIKAQQQYYLSEYMRQRTSIGAMIAAAPLLGLLGTVAGMVKTFESLASPDGQKSMEGLAGGISEVLTATESGLAVALPAMLILHLIHRGAQKRLKLLVDKQDPL